MKKIIALLAMFSLAISAANHSFAAAPTDQEVKKLQASMKQFKNRVRAYWKCIRGTCTPAEKKALSQHVKKDAAKLLLYGGLTAGIVSSYWWAPKLQKKIQITLAEREASKEKAEKKHLQELRDQYQKEVSDKEVSDKEKIIGIEIIDLKLKLFTHVNVVLKSFVSDRNVVSLTLEKNALPVLDEKSRKYIKSLLQHHGFDEVQILQDGTEIQTFTADNIDQLTSPTSQSTEQPTSKVVSSPQSPQPTEQQKLQSKIENEIQDKNLNLKVLKIETIKTRSDDKKIKMLRVLLTDYKNIETETMFFKQLITHDKAFDQIAVYKNPNLETGKILHIYTSKDWED